MFLLYSFLNGLIFIGTFIFENLYWILGIVLFLFLYWQEVTIVNDEYVSEMRQLL